MNANRRGGFPTSHAQFINNGFGLGEFLGKRGLMVLAVRPKCALMSVATSAVAAASAANNIHKISEQWHAECNNHNIDYDFDCSHSEAMRRHCQIIVKRPERRGDLTVARTSTLRCPGVGVDWFSSF